VQLASHQSRLVVVDITVVIVVVAATAFGALIRPIKYLSILRTSLSVSQYELVALMECLEKMAQCHQQNEQPQQKFFFPNANLNDAKALGMAEDPEIDVSHI